MLKIEGAFSVGKYTVLRLSGEKPKTEYSKYVINEKTYDAVPMYDAMNCIAIETSEKSEKFIGETVGFQ